ncbi:unnamed protein product [Mycetohabitans rhizoxinica HKI 454]|uniref:Uncharacterized protein n=1 Tax=Mycetohabitans rhizoxinica (strain DSM 19002 / CIP 109453 / HKI 454) TaxID=882378 RepID=E5AL69_MYCRK|nr:unnamed protein product [Mycetohabitans rhizoxinica HKI 454]
MLLNAGEPAQPLWLNIFSLCLDIFWISKLGD